MQHTTSHANAIQSPSHFQRYILISKHWYPYGCVFSCVIPKQATHKHIHNVYRKAERQRIESYQQDLDEIKERVKQRPLLFEQAAQVGFCLSLCLLSVALATVPEHHSRKCKLFFVLYVSSYCCNYRY